VGVGGKTDPDTPLHVIGTVTATTFAGSGASLTSIPNSALTNSSVTINSTAVSLGGSLTLTTANIAENTNLYYTDARADARIAAADTDDLSEGSSNLYYTDARVDARVSGGSLGNITTTGYIRGPATFTIDPAAHGDNSGTVVIAGNLQVDGTTTTINSTTMTVDDKNITLASGSANAAAASGAGFTVDIGSGTNPTITYDGTNDEWDFNKDINVTGAVTADGLEVEAATPVIEIDSTTAANLATLQFTTSGTVDSKITHQASSGDMVIESGRNSTWGGKIYLKTDTVQNAVFTRTTSTFNENGADIDFRVEGVGNANALFVQGSDGNVGIGTTAPTQKLQVNGPLVSTDQLASPGSAGAYTYNATALDYSSNGARLWSWGSSSARGTFNFIQLENDGQNQQTAMSIDSSGNVGINPSSGYSLVDKLTIRGSQSQLRIQDSSADAKGVSLLYSNSNNYGQLLCDHRGNNQLNFYYSALNHYFGRNTSSSYIYMTLTDTGNVGIGTTTPTQPLHVYQDGGYFASVSRGNSTPGGSDPWLGLFNNINIANANFGWGIYDSNSDGSFQIWNKNNSTTGYNTFTIKRGGNVGIGTSSPTGSLHVTAKDSGGADVYIVAQNTTNNRISGYKILDEGGNIQGLWRYDNGGNYASLSVGTAAAPTTITLGESSTGISFTSTATSFNSGKVATIRGEVGGTGYGNLAFDTFQGGSGGGERMMIRYDGNVGIGTTAPLGKLSVGAGSINDAGLPVQISTGADGTQAWYAVNRNGAYGALFGYSASSTYKGLVLRNVVSSGTANADGISFMTNNTSMRMHITGAGNVGIGTASPNAALTIRGAGSSGSQKNTIAFGTSGWGNPTGPGTALDGAVKLALFEGGTQKVQIGMDANARLWLSSCGSGASGIDFYTGASNTDAPSRRLRIDQAGLASFYAGLNVTGRVGLNQTPLSNNFTLQVTGMQSNGSDARVMYLKGAGTATSIGTTGPTLVLQNTNNTANNIVKLSFESASAGETVSINAINTNHTSHYGDMAFNTRGSAGYSEKMRIESNGNVGIGTHTPNAPLSFGVTSVNSQVALIRDNGNSRTGFGITSNYGVRVFGPSDASATGNVFEVGQMLGTNGTTYQNTRFAVQYDGNVGIGTNDPAVQLHINKGATTYQPAAGVVKNYFALNTDYNAAGIQGVYLSQLDGNWIDGTSGADTAFGMLFGYANATRGGLIYDHRGSEKLQLFSSYGALAFITSNAADGDGVPTDSNMVERLTILPGGNVGIGTTSPGYKLEISDDTNGTVNLLKLRNADGTYSQTWDFQLDTSKHLVITGGSGSGGIVLNPGTTGTTVNSGLYVVSNNSSNAFTVKTNHSGNPTALQIGGAGAINGVASSNQSFTILNVAKDSGSNKSAYFHGHVKTAGVYNTTHTSSVGHETSINILNNDPVDGGSDFDQTPTNNVDGGGTTWSISGSGDAIYFENTSGGHGGTWMKVNVEQGYYVIKGTVRLTNTDQTNIHGSTSTANYKYTHSFRFEISGGPDTGHLKWDADAIATANGTDFTRAGFCSAPVYMAAGNKNIVYNTNGYNGVQQIYITNLELVRIG